MPPRICLDAGHYGKYNQSPVNRKYYESDMAWKLHSYLKAELEACGFEVITTRASQNTDLEVYKRGQKAKGCDLFLSLHSNAAGTEAPDYAVACCQIDDDSRLSEAIGRKLAAVVNSTMGSKGKWTIWEREGNNNADYYGVLRGAKSVGVAGVLLEHGFHTNRANTAWLLKDANLKKLAQAEAKVLADYFGLTKDTAKPAVAVKYYPKTAYKGVSLVDGLKSVKADSSFKNRTKIAKANGISVYLGTPTQNTKLLRLLKEGKLVKP